MNRSRLLTIAAAVVALAVSGVWLSGREFQLSAEELEKLDGRGSVNRSAQRFEGTVYNGNKKIQLTEIEVLLFTPLPQATEEQIRKSGGRYATDQEYQAELDENQRLFDSWRRYVVPVQIVPLTSAKVSFDAVAGQDEAKEWRFVSAKGKAP